LKNKQLEKIKLKTFGRIVLIILWICLIFLTTKGIISILNPNKLSKEDIKIETSKNTASKIIEDNAVSFAENFTKEYLSYYGDEDEYKKRISLFTSNNLDFENTTPFNVTYVNAINHYWSGKNTILVDCVIRGSVYNPEGKDKTVVKIPDEKVYYLRIAVSVFDGNFLISDYPTFISSPSKIQLETTNNIDGTELDDENKKNNIKNVITSFLTAYNRGQNTEMKYFAENLQIKESGKPFDFESLKDIQINWNEKDEFYVKTSYYVSKDGSRFTQNMEFKLKMKTDKYIITKYNTKIY